MKKLESYINGQWVYGSGEGVPMVDAVTGEIVALSNTTGFDLSEVLHYGRLNERFYEK